MTRTPSRRTPLRHRKENPRHAAARKATGQGPGVRGGPAEAPRAPKGPPRVLEVMRHGSAPPWGQCDVLYKDQHVLMVEKAAGLLTVPPDAGHPPTVMSWLRHRLKGAHDQVFAVHRLDRDTSGVLVVARTRHALDALVRDLTHRLFHRVYLAIVVGNPPSAGTLEGNLGTVGKDLRMRSLEDGEGQRAVTHFRVVEQAQGHALVAFKLDTGRRNQIRVQVAEVGFPILGEKQYGQAESPLIRRQALHSHRLHLRHPITGVHIQAVAPLPEDMLRAWRSVGGRHGGTLPAEFEVPGPGARTFTLTGRGNVDDAEEAPRAREPAAPRAQARTAEREPPARTGAKPAPARTKRNHDDNAGIHEGRRAPRETGKQPPARPATPRGKPRTGKPSRAPRRGR